MQLGELRLWSEPGPFAALVAVIRGDPPEGLHDAMRNTLSRIHAERHHALEDFSGDSSGLGDVEARLRELVALGAHEPPRARLGRVILLALLLLLLLSAGAWMAWRWYDQQLWEGYLERLRAQPGIVVAEAGKRDGKFVVSGLRDPLAVDPLALLGEAGIDPARVVAQFDPYQALDPQSVLKRLEASLDPPSSVTLEIAGNRIVARGSAPRPWLDRAHAVAQMLPAGAPSFDLTGVRNDDEAAEQSRQVVERQWQAYVDRLGAEPGIVITQSEARGDKFILSGLRDPLAVDPLKFLDETGIDPARVVAHFDPYQALDPQFVLERLQASLNPPPGVTLSIDGDRIVAQGSASSPWIARARAAGRLLPAGAPVFDVSAVRNISEGALGKLRDAIQARSIRFDSGVSLPAAGQEKILDEIASELNELATLASNLNVVTRVTLTGHSDDKGQGTSNLSLSVARAEAVRALLNKRGVDPDLLAVRGAGPLEPLEADTSEVRPLDQPPGLVLNRDRGRTMTAVLQKKICMLGGFSVGKTSLVKRYVHSVFSESYLTTVGVKIDKKTVDLSDRTVNLILWDLAGEDDINTFRMTNLRGAAGYVLVADGTRPSTLDVALSLRQRVEAEYGPLPFVLLLNKSDLKEQWAVSDADLARLRQNGWWVQPSSAQTGEGVEDAFTDLAVRTTS